MAKKQNEEKHQLKKSRANFEVIGEVGKLGEWTYSIDATSSSGFKYSSMKLNVKVSDNNTISVEAMGGYFPNKTDNIIKVRGKDDPNEMIEVAWEDRKNKDIIDVISNLNIINIALEKDVNNKLVYKKFLSWYDAIEYVQAHLKQGDRIKVRGNLVYSEYNETVQVRKNIQSIYLVDESDEKVKNEALFTQTILTTSSDMDKSHAKEDKIIDISAKVVDYDKNLGAQRAFDYLFKVKLEDGQENARLSVCKKLIPEKKTILREITVVGNIVEGAEVSNITAKDIPQELQDLIDCGIYTEEEILNKMIVKGHKIVSFFITKPAVSEAKEGQLPTILVSDDKYTLDDLIVEAPTKSSSDDNKFEKELEALDEQLEDTDSDENDELEDTDSDEDYNDLSWMKELDD